MYHSLAMEDLLDLISISNKLPNIFPTEDILKIYSKGMSWLDTMIYNNNELAHFNDCARLLLEAGADTEATCRVRVL